MTKFLGAQRINFVDQKSGERIQGYNFWFSEPAGDGSIGFRPFKHFMSDHFAEEFLGENGVSGLAAYVGRSCVITYNRYGKISHLSFEE